MLLYSATLESLARAGYRDLDTHRQVFPSFVSVLGLQFDRPTGFFFYDSESLALVLHPGRPPEHNLSPDEGEADEKDDESEPQPALELPLIHSLPVTVPKMEEAEDDAEEDDDEVPMEPSSEDIEPARDQLCKLIPDQGEYNVMY